MTRFLFGFLIFVFFALANTASARDFAIEKAWYEDTSGTQTWEQVRQQPFHAYRGILNKGVSRSAFWIRLKVDSRGYVPVFSKIHDDRQLIVRITPGYLDEIRLFDPQEKTALTRVTGMLYGASHDEYQSINFNFVIPRTDNIRYVWLRIKTATPTMADIKVLSVADTISLDKIQQNLVAINLFIIFFAIALTIYAWIINKDKLILLFTIRQIGTFLFMFFITGYARPLLDGVLPPVSLNKILDGTIVTFIAFAFIFEGYFFRRYAYSHWIMKASAWLAVFPPIALALVILDQSYLAYQISGYTLITDSVLSLACILIIYVKHRDKISDDFVVPKKYILLVYGSIYLGFFATSLSIMGLIKLNQVRDSLVPMGGIIYFINSLLIMSFYFNHIRKKQLLLQQQNLVQVMLAEQSAIQEKNYRLEQENLFSMLAHELKTPLAILNMRIGKLPASDSTVDSMKRAIRDMNGVIERCIDASKVLDKKLTPIIRASNLHEELLRQQQLSRDPHNIAIKCPDPLIVNTDPQILAIVLNNLIDNACKYSPTNSTVNVEVMANHDGEAMTNVQIVISNYPGLAGWPDPEKLFTKFYRSQNAYHQVGSGLGLFIVQQLVYLLGGSITYMPSRTHVRFEVCLPA
ncbi:sensor histidine kinase [Leeia oryzae]|uniref:sensor histidine kinase n=1 Tax=Leeia oryzae TaxID=356662 RepID=UPI00037FFB84|nr:sensor histidine kinase [Leeia oryzae]